MRKNILKKHSTKAERIVYEELKQNKIDFKHRVKILGREVDFLIGNIVIELDGHEQDTEKNILLANSGFIPLHFSNKEIKNNRSIIIKTLEKVYDFNKIPRWCN